jgi:hypothetical protein
MLPFSRLGRDEEVWCQRGGRVQAGREEDTMDKGSVTVQDLSTI